MLEKVGRLVWFPVECVLLQKYCFPKVQNFQPYLTLKMLNNFVNILGYICEITVLYPCIHLMIYCAVILHYVLLKLVEISQAYRHYYEIGRFLEKIYKYKATGTHKYIIYIYIYISIIVYLYFP